MQGTIPTTRIAQAAWKQERKASCKAHIQTAVEVHPQKKKDHRSAAYQRQSRANHSCIVRLLSHDLPWPQGGSNESTTTTAVLVPGRKQSWKIQAVNREPKGCEWHSGPKHVIRMEGCFDIESFYRFIRYLTRHLGRY